MLYLDTNIIIVYLTNTPEQQGQQVHSLFRELAIGAIVATTTEGVLVEATQVLVSKKWLAYPRQQIAKELTTILEFRGLRLENRDVHVRALGRFGSGNLDYVDCILIEMATDPEDAVVSFDRDYDRALPGIRVEPATVLQEPIEPDAPSSKNHQNNGDAT